MPPSIPLLQSMSLPQSIRTAVEADLPAISIYLAERARRMGLGKALLERAIVHAPSLGIDSPLGFIFGHNLASLSLFEAHGFARWGVLPRVASLDGVERDLIIAGRRLDPSDVNPS